MTRILSLVGKIEIAPLAPNLDAQLIVDGGLILAQASGLGADQSGEINIEATFAGLFDSTISSGSQDFNGGTSNDVSIRSLGSLDIVGSDIILDTLSSEFGGSLYIEAGALTIDGGSSLSASTVGSARAGGITIDAQSVDLVDGTLATETVGTGGAGPIGVSAPQITLTKGAISATSIAGDGSGGNIDILAYSLDIGNDFEVTSNLFELYGGGGGGRAGTITLPRLPTQSEGAFRL